MKKYLFFFISLVFHCFNAGAVKHCKTVGSLTDTSGAFRIEEFKIFPKKSFDLNSILKYSGDTLHLVTCSNFVFYPFGKINSEKELKSSLLKGFNITTKIEAANKLQILKLNSNRLILFFDKDPEASTASYIIKGEIYDKSINFINDVKIGINKNDFYRVFFDNFPDELTKRYDVVILESCVDGIKHVYSFKESKLSSVKFECVECTWKTDY